MRCRPCAAPSGRGRLTGAAQRNANGAATPHGGIVDATSADRSSAPASEPRALVALGGYGAARPRVAAADDIATGDEAPRGKAGWEGAGDGAWVALPAASADTTGPAEAWLAGDGRTGGGPAAVADVSAGSAEAASAEDLVGGDTVAKDRVVEDGVVEDGVIGGRVVEDSAVEDSAVEEALGSGEPLPRHRWTASPDSRGGGGPTTGGLGPSGYPESRRRRARRWPRSAGQDDRYVAAGPPAPSTWTAAAWPPVRRAGRTVAQRGGPRRNGEGLRRRAPSCDRAPARRARAPRARPHDQGRPGRVRCAAVRGGLPWDGQRRVRPRPARTDARPRAGRDTARRPGWVRCGAVPEEEGRSEVERRRAASGGSFTGRGHAGHGGRDGFDPWGPRKIPDDGHDATGHSASCK